MEYKSTYNRTQTKTEMRYNTARLCNTRTTGDLTRHAEQVQYLIIIETVFKNSGKKKIESLKVRIEMEVD
jgi:hypothetical protein